MLLYSCKSLSHYNMSDICQLVELMCENHQNEVELFATRHLNVEEQIAFESIKAKQMKRVSFRTYTFPRSETSSQEMETQEVYGGADINFNFEAFDNIDCMAGS
jgi:hypothetical protein